MADAVVVGSALVGKIAALLDRPDSIPAELADTCHEMRAAIDATG